MDANLLKLITNTSSI